MAWKLTSASISNLGLVTMPDLLFPERIDALRHAIVVTCSGGSVGAAPLYELLQQLDQGGHGVTTPPRFLFSVTEQDATSEELKDGKSLSQEDVIDFKKILLTFTSAEQYLFYRDYPGL